MMVLTLLIGISILSINVLIQAVFYVYWLRSYSYFFLDKQEKQTNFSLIKVLFSSVICITLMHLLQSSVWALVYYFNNQITEITTFSDATYFSIVTFTTLGYGDISISSHWRLLSGIEAINGIILIGWSTALLYSLLQAIFKNKRNQHLASKKY